MNTQLNSAVAAALLIGTLTFSSPLFAQPGATPNANIVSQIVTFADLDVSSPQDARVLYGRIRTAAWRVCLQLVSDSGGPNGIARARCNLTLTDAAVRQLNSPLVTALNNGRPAPSDLHASR